jgi:hypothetical protein
MLLAAPASSSTLAREDAPRGYHCLRGQVVVSDDLGFDFTSAAPEPANDFETNGCGDLVDTSGM